MLCEWHGGNDSVTVVHSQCKVNVKLKNYNLLQPMSIANALINNMF